MIGNVLIFELIFVLLSAFAPVHSLPNLKIYLFMSNFFVPLHSNKFRKQNSYMKREDIQYALNTAKLQKGDILLINDYEENLRKK